MKKVVTIIVCILILAPIVLICLLSSKEMSQFDNDTEYDFVEKALGEVKPVLRRDIKEYYQVSGEFVSGKQEIVRLIEEKNVLYIKAGDEVLKNQIIAESKTGKAIKSPCNGVISEINGDNQYIRIDSFDKILLQCTVSESICKDIEEEEKLLTSKNESVKINGISNICEDGCQKIYFDIDSKKYMAGQKNKKFKIYTGNTYESVLTIDNDCVYKKEDGMYYVRLVDEMGKFLNEQQVEVGYSNDKYACITGIDENVYCDSGYKMLIETGE